MSQAKERQEVIRKAEALTWHVAEKPNKKGYLKMKCPCGKHIKWLHKTPSNPNYWNETIQYLESICKNDPPAAGDTSS